MRVAAALLLSHSVALASDSSGCKRGTRFGKVETFWVPDWSPSKKNHAISHRQTPFVSPLNDYVIGAGLQGINRWANITVHEELDIQGDPWGNGVVDESSGLPLSIHGGWPTASADLHEYWDDGFLPERFNVLLQKGSTTKNVQLLTDQVVGPVGTGEDYDPAAPDATKQNVVRLHAVLNNSSATAASVEQGTLGAPPELPGHGALLQTAGLFSSGFYEVKAKLPPKEGLVFAMWTFHYETHFAPGNPYLSGQVDPQFLNVTGSTDQLNHEIDIEIPASCLEFCKPLNGCGGQFATMNLNTYKYTNDNGDGPAYSNICVNASDNGARKARSFADGKWHTYGFEWHTGDRDQTRHNTCRPRVDFFFDGEYITTNDVFVPTRASRLVFGLYPTNNEFWAGKADYTETYMDVAEVHVCRFDEDRDAAYPQILDQPDYHPKWTNLTLKPKGGESEGEGEAGKPASRRLSPRLHSVCTFSPDAPSPKAPPAPAPAPAPTPAPKPPTPSPSPKKPSGCQAAQGRPNGCACSHSFQCASEWCDGHCKKHP